MRFLNTLMTKIALIVAAALATATGDVVRGDEIAEPLTFEQHVRPILRAHCFDCHGATSELKGGLDLRQVRLMLQGGESGAAIVPGTAAASRLVDKVRTGEMPPGDARLSDREVDVLVRWIDQGSRTVRPEPEEIPPGLGLTPEDRSFWSFRPIIRPDVPQVAASVTDRVRNPIDAFLLAAMPEGLSFAPDADRPRLIRRLYADLTGLAPTREDQQRWQQDPGSDWYERLIEELLASPHYGERWARHWLDVAGYADSDGYTVSDSERPWAWKYRDYVIRSFNSDKPIDRFITEQLAGDELAGPRQGDLTPEQIELLSATGFLRMAADGTGSGANDEVGRNQAINDALRIVSSSLLGVTMACAQCHDHRYDPILQTDYFALRAVFAPALDWQQWKTPAERMVSLYTEADRRKAAEIDAEAATIDAARSAKQSEYMQQALDQELTRYQEPLREQLRLAYVTAADQRTDEQKALLDRYPSVNISPGVLYQYLPAAAEDLKKYDARIAEVRARKPPEEFLAVLIEPPGHAPETHLFHRGDHQQPRQVVYPAPLAVACSEDDPVTFPLRDEQRPTTGRRLALASWLTGPQNPLTPRVMVNRIWLHHFGRGIVATPADFGQLGSRPTHPELLDWLAAEFMQQGFSLRKLHRLILSSTAWRQSVQRTPAHDALDPDNRYFSRRALMRLDAEVLRDQMLAAGGQLDPTLFGPPVPVKEDDAGQVIVDPAQTRRSLYIKARRTQPVAMLQAFDAPVMETNCEIRPVSTVATQSLMLMNSESILHFARQLADRCRREPADVPPELTARGTALAVGADPWQFGFGSVGATGQVESFTRLPHWTGSAWQGGPELPDPQLGYALLQADGGHPDIPARSVIRRWIAPADGVISVTGSLQHGNPNGDGVRGRLVRSGSIRTEAPSDRVVVGTEVKAVQGEWTAFSGAATTDVPELPVSAGDIVDFVTDCRENYTSDSFSWTVTITLRQTGQADRVFSSVEGFRGPSDHPAALPAQMVRAWQLAYGRDPDEQEISSSLEFLAQQLETINAGTVSLPQGQTALGAALTGLCHALITSNEFLYVD